ncbi:MAG: BrnT family toxin, partial [Pseudomonadota bacterium]
MRFDWASAVTRADTRRDYGEPRFISFGMLDGVICACAWTPRGDTVRIIMLRRANARERKRYERDREAENLYRRE